ncbi:MAG: MFS transporter [Gammaproteobacteria bacterium HGW-Gammaproteobacteria-1]|jgi:PAT family beta-lactamase induction signal transducer AmpG|nr:MAG: MFS transporter [Gammaproteobacteria bacterium HGW-Gammaproteobacteria-1]
MSSEAKPSLLKSKMFWVGVLYFAEGFPLGVFFDVFPVHFRQQGVNLSEIGFLSLLGLAWTLKFLWAPAVDHYRHHRRWMALVDLGMGAVMLAMAVHAGFGPWTWLAIGLFTLLSATNDIAIDGYTIELLDRRELGLANGLRVGFYRVGMLAAGFILILSDYIGWTGTYFTAAALFVLIALTCLRAPAERRVERVHGLSLRAELGGLLAHPLPFAGVLGFLLGTLWLIDRTTHWSARHESFWLYAFGAAGLALLASVLRHRRNGNGGTGALTEGPMFGTLLAMVARPYMLPVIGFILIFKLGDAAMGFMVKPFWVDAGFSASQIGTVSVNLGLILSIAGGIAGGWFTDRAGIFRALWVLGLCQAFSNLGYAWAATVLPLGTPTELITASQQMLMYAASGLESFTGGLGTAAFLAFLMAIVDKRHSATEYALLSSVFALSRSLAGWAGGFGAEAMGYADYFLLTFFLGFPAFLLLPWVRRMLDRPPS